MKPSKMIPDTPKPKMSFFGIMPKCGIIPTLIYVFSNVLVYTMAKVFADSGHHYSLALPIDIAFPLLPGFIFPYLASYVF